MTPVRRFVVTAVIPDEVVRLERQVLAARGHRPFARELACGPKLYTYLREVGMRTIDGLPVVMDPDLVSFVVR